MRIAHTQRGLIHHVGEDVVAHDGLHSGLDLSLDFHVGILWRLLDDCHDVPGSCFTLLRSHAGEGTNVQDARATTLGTTTEAQIRRELC